jgi:hypothetical protein
MEWRGFIGTDWEIVRHKLERDDLWTTTKLVKVSYEAVRRATATLAPIVLDDELSDDLIWLEKMDGLRPW